MFGPSSILIVVVAGSAAVDAAVEVEAPADRIVLDYREARWNEVLDDVAKRLRLVVHAEIVPPGRFTYHDSRSRSPREALELIHGVLAERGFALVEKGGLLLVVLLADAVHWELAPYLSAEELDAAAPTRIVSTTLTLHSLSADRAVGELEPTLSPRGRIVGTGSANRLVLCDRASVVRQVRALLETIDQPTGSVASRTRIFELRHANAAEVAAIARELLGSAAAPSAVPGGLPIDFRKVGRQLGNAKMLESFVPGFSFSGIAPDEPRPRSVPRIAIDERRNLLLVTGEPDALALTANLVRATDVPTRPRTDTAAGLRSYRVADGMAERLADRIGRLFADDPNFKISGSADALLVRATARQHARVAKVLKRATTATLQAAVFPLTKRIADDLAPQFRRLFEIEPEGARPLFVADPIGNHLLVRGTTDQVEQVKRLLTGLGEFGPASSFHPRREAPNRGERPSSRQSEQR